MKQYSDITNHMVLYILLIAGARISCMSFVAFGTSVMAGNHYDLKRSPGNGGFLS